MKHRRPVTWDDIRAKVSQIAAGCGEWAGMPLPVEGMSMTIHPSYPFAERFSGTFAAPPSARICRNEDVREDTAVRNSWRSYRDGREVTIFRDGQRFCFAYTGRQNAVPMILQTIGAARAWDYKAELRAMETLKRHVTEWAFECYLLTGSFLESSTRSGIMYVFRRLRPTIALSGKPSYFRRCAEQDSVRILCCLCMHPIGLYNNSWAGALVPTDDVLAHLLLMRGDEHKYWAQCNQHPVWAPEAGV